MSVLQEATEYKAMVREKLGDKFHVLSDDIERVKASGLAENALKEGQNAPDFTLPDAFGNQVSLVELLKEGPVVISFYRGEWCPFCNMELRGLQKVLPQLTELGATLVAISPENPDHGIVMSEKNQLTFPVLSDHGNAVARKFGIVFQVGQELKEFSKNVFNNDLALRNGEDSYELPAPATFVVDQQGVIRLAYVNVDYMTGRLEPESVVTALKALKQ